MLGTLICSVEWAVDLLDGVINQAKRSLQPS